MHRRALKHTLIVASIVGLPLLTLIYLDQNKLNSEHISIEPFYITNSHGQMLANHLLTNHVTIVLTNPQANDVPLANALQDYVENTLQTQTLRPISYRLVTFSSLPPLSQWIDFEEKPHFLPPGHCLLIDGNGIITYQKALKDVDINHMKTLMSKVSFNLALNTYLSKRTFMGPKILH
jgi:hypothetical protein